METYANREPGGDVGSLWWTLETRGIIALLFGIIAIALPGMTLLALLILFGVYAIVDGLISLVAAFTTRRWWPYLLIGFVGLAAGIVAFAYPGRTLLTLLYIIAVWAVVVGLAQIAHAFAGQIVAGSRFMWGVSGVLSVLFGIVLIASPISGLLSVVWLIGFFALVYGFSLIALGFELRSRYQGLRGVVQH
ncbi:MAG: HdeD family acid-resistance protein [Armatimonadota bacterium]